MGRILQYVETLGFHCSKENQWGEFADVKTLLIRHLALGWSQTTGALWHFAK